MNNRKTLVGVWVLLVAMAAMMAAVGRAEVADETVIVEDLLAAYGSHQDLLRSYCLLYARLETRPGDAWTLSRLQKLQGTARSLKTKGAQTRAARGFYHFTAGRPVEAAREWRKALKARTLPAPIKERIEKLLSLG